MAHRHTAYNNWPRRAIRTKSWQQCGSESGEVLETRNRLSQKQFDWVTTDFVYVRWLGDRKGMETLTTTWDKTV